MTALLGMSPAAFIGLTVILAGGCAFMMGQALARTWRPWWLVLPYGLLLAAANRFLAFALFDGVLLDFSGFIAAAIPVIGLGLFGYRLTQVRSMVSQYPWAYRQKGLLGWEDIGPRPN